MKRRLFLLNGAALGLLAACGPAPLQSTKRSVLALPSATLHIAVTGAEHATVLEVARPLLMRRRVAMVLQDMEDLTEANRQLQQGRIDAVCFETRAAMDAFNRANDAQLAVVAGVNIEPRYGVFSRAHRSWRNAHGGEVVAIPQDPVTRGRALLLLRRSGVIDLKDPTNLSSNVADISVNSLRLQFREVGASDLRRAVDEADFVIMDVRDAEAVGLDSRWDALDVERDFSRFAKFLIARSDNAQDARILALAAALASSDIAAVLNRADQGHFRAVFQ